MKAIDHSIGAALQACTSQAPVKETKRPAAPVAGGPEHGRERGIRRDREPVRERDRAEELHLTPRQLEVLALVCEGMQNKQICRRLNIAPGTVKVHISCLLRAFGVRSRVGILVEAQRRGLVNARDVPMELRSRDLLSRLLASGSGLESAAQAKQAAAATVAGSAAVRDLLAAA